ncbi:Uncharacterized protein APZ42_019591 [Daphnia magna]|uniref:Uncharacterized protein n=1 Tax=Daphnia magna TaxID=35525 RepID=A0A0P5BY50_9CRUS|nr:Uncharacterized protein APZ42_019591 [Daphnia magna]
MAGTENTEHEDHEMEEHDDDTTLDTSENPEETSVEIADDEQEEPPFSIHDEREKCIWVLWIAFLVTLVGVVIGTTLYINQVYFFIKDPEPTFSSTDILNGFRHDFFHEARTFNESQRICFARNSYLIVFNNTEEHTRFNDYVTETFQPFIRNNTDRWKRVGLQIWTGIRIIFQAGELTHFDWPTKEESPEEMLRFYFVSQEHRLCNIGTIERMRLIRKAMQSKHKSRQFIVKDFTGKAENAINETGCWQVRILEENESLILPFVCKSQNPESTQQL